MNFENKVAISTGAASGMGLLFAENFAALGGHVVMCDVNEAALNEKAAAINAKAGGRALAVACDVRDYAQVCAARDKAVEAFGRIDVVANFAGGTATRVLGVDTKRYPEFPDVPIEVFDWGIDVNLKGPFYFAHAVLKQMREQGSGLVINIGSIMGAEGTAYGMDYPTSKAGLMYGLTKSIAQYGAKYNVRCCCVALSGFGICLRVIAAAVRSLPPSWQFSICAKPIMFRWKMISTAIIPMSDCWKSLKILTASRIWKTSERRKSDGNGRTAKSH